jgi:hypothetical protein
VPLYVFLVPIVALVIGHLLIKYEVNTNINFQVYNEARKDYLWRTYGYLLSGFVICNVSLILTSFLGNSKCDTIDLRYIRSFLRKEKPPWLHPVQQ